MASCTASMSNSNLFKEKSSFGFSFTQDADLDIDDTQEQLRNEVIPPAVQVDKQQYIPPQRQFQLNQSAQHITESGPRRLEPLNSVEGAHYLLPYLNLKEGDEPARLREPRGWLELSVEAPFTANEESDQAEQRWDAHKADLTFNYKRRAREAQKSKRRRNNTTADDI